MPIVNLMKDLKNHSLVLSGIILIFIASSGHTQNSDQGKIELIHQNFDEDPGWDNYHNRIICNDCPLIVQDFGPITPL